MENGKGVSLQYWPILGCSASLGKDTEGPSVVVEEDKGGGGARNGKEPDFFQPPNPISRILIQGALRIQVGLSEARNLCLSLWFMPGTGRSTGPWYHNLGGFSLLFNLRNGQEVDTQAVHFQ